MGKSTIKNLFILTRINSPTGFLLPFFTACFGLGIADHLTVQFLFFIPIFFIGSVVTRSAGCIINDLMDKDFDKNVARTSRRPLSSGLVTVTEALVMLIILLSISLIILLSLTKTAVYIGVVAFFMIVLYPLMKRITNLPQLFLGLTYNLGILIAYASVEDAISSRALMIYLGCCLWTIGYDTIYGFMDLKDDKKIGVKSMAILLENLNYKIYLGLFYCSFMLIFALATWQFLSSGISLVILLWQIYTLDITDSANCLFRFKSNNYVGAILSIALLASKL